VTATEQRPGTPSSTPAPEAIAGDGGVRSYHGQPVLKEPIWTWEIPCYFYAGGLTGASAGLAYLAELRGNDVLARRAWLAATIGGTASPVLLTMDLGRPERFLNMLRMFKVTSPMSMGSWILVAAGGCAPVAALDSFTGRVPGGRFARAVAAALGLPLATYTAALVANTAIPVWHQAHRMLPFVFASGAALSAGAAAVALAPVEAAAPARRLALAGAVAELATSERMERRLGELGEPYHQGAAGRLRRISRATVAGGALLLVARARSSRRAAVASGALLSIGALSARWSVFKAGFQSAADPKYVIGPQRASIERGERRGAARSQARHPA
jgi:DMSO reductase anchor subunit